MYEVNLIAVLVSAVVAFIIGFLAHGPIAGKLWMKLANITPTGNEKMSDMYPQMGMNLLANIITAFVIAILFNVMMSSTLFTNTALCAGLTSAFLGWLGFGIIGTAMDPIWMKASWKLWIFEAITSLVMLLAMGAIIANW